ncbi:TetR family transcriptional regulator C-terminal domain-containing protein [Amycolatopsis sp. MEPSY49]|uniref:TetR family transcriptional regulator C-terminal domain-containing protein n=1 Tax=Amycolatopsis sp. MEPSY49 TaxID=3151600 RepID=UPI003F51A994
MLVTPVGSGYWTCRAGHGTFGTGPGRADRTGQPRRAGHRQRDPADEAARTEGAIATPFLNGTVQATTRPGCPAGCLGVQGSPAAGDVGRPARDALVEWRNHARRHLEQRFRRAVDEGDLPRDAEPGRLARYVMTVSFGIAVQAASGISRGDLQEIADTALRTWPPIRATATGRRPAPRHGSEMPRDRD